MTTTRWMTALGLTLAAAGIAGAGCAAFSGEDDPPAATNPEDGGGGTDAPKDGSGPVVIGQPGPLAVTVVGAARIQQGGTVKVHVKVDRGAVPGDVIVRGESLPEGLGSKELVLPEGKGEGDVELSAAASVKQGPVDKATIIARAKDGRANGAKLDLFVRGTPGSRDTTYGADGTLDLGVGNSFAAATSDKHLIVATTVLQRFDRLGTLDTSFKPDPAAFGVQLAPGQNDALYVRNTNARHLFANGSLDTGYGNAGTSPVNPGVYLSSSIFANNAGELLMWGTVGYLSAVKAYKVTPTGFQAGDFNFADWKRPGSADHTASSAFALQDGTFLAVMIGGKAAAVSVLHILADGSLDTTFAQGAGYADMVLSGDSTAAAGISAAVLQPSGLFLLTLTNRYERFMVVKFGLDGVADAAFGDVASPGMALSLTTHTIGAASGGMDIDPQGRVILASKTKVAGAESIAIQRLTAQGGADTTFGTNGFVTFPSDAPTAIRKVFVADSERILLLHSTSNSNGNTLISRFWM